MIISPQAYEKALELLELPPDHLLTYPEFLLALDIERKTMADKRENYFSENYQDRHPSVLEVAKYLDPNPNLQGVQHMIAQMFGQFTEELLDTVEDDSPELTVALRKLLEAKDAAVRASLKL